MGFISGTPSKQSSTQSASNSSQSGNQAYNTLTNALAPTLGYGAQAGSMMGALLGIPSNPAPAPIPSSNPSTPLYNPAPTYAGNPTGYQTNPTGEPRERFDLGSDLGYTGFGNTSAQTGYGGGGGNIPYIYGTPPETPQYQYQSQSQPQSQSQATPLDASSALDNFSHSAGMDFLRNQGVKAIEASQAGKGMLQSGATGQALTSFGNNLATTYLNDYLTHLNDYASLGTKNAAILSGAGNYSNSTGLSSGTSSGKGPKNGLIQDVGTLLSAAGGGSGIADIIPFL